MKNFLLLVYLLQTTKAFAYQTLNTELTVGSNSKPTTSSVLDVRSTTKGFLPPRMTTTQKNAISSPATGLIVNDTTLNELQRYNGTTWDSVGGGGGTINSPVDGGILYSNGGDIYASGAGTAGRAVLSGGSSAPTFFNPGVGDLIFGGASGVLANSSNVNWSGTILDVNGTITPDTLTSGGTVTGNALVSTTSVTAASMSATGTIAGNALTSTTSVSAASMSATGTIGANALTSTTSVSADSAAITNGVTATSVTADQSTYNQIATPSNPAAGKNKLYFKNDDKVYKLTSAGVEAEIGVGNGGDTSPAIFTFQTASGSNGGTATAEAWTKVPLATEVLGQSFATLGSNVITINESGKYRFKCWQSFYHTDQTGIRLRKTNATSATVTGSTVGAYVKATDDTTPPLFFDTIVTAAANDTFEFQYHVDTGTSSASLGFAQLTASGEVNIFGQCIIAKQNVDADTIVEATNTFHARISAVGAVVSEDADWISSISKGGTGIYNITFTAGFFAVAPAIQVSGGAPNRIANYDSTTTSGVTVRIVTDGGSSADDDFTITAGRQTGDWNVGASVSQNYAFAGSSYLPATTNCTPTVATGGVLSAFGTDADCPAMTIEYSELGTWSTADQNKFSQVIDSLPAGTYRACVEFITSINGTEVMGVAINDGTTSSPTTGYGGHSSASQFGARRCAIFRYASAGTRTFQPYVISGGSTITHQNAGSFASYFTLERIKP